jgi:hypothetical protein
VRVFLLFLEVRGNYGRGGGVFVCPALAVLQYVACPSTSSRALETVALRSSRDFHRLLLLIIIIIIIFLLVVLFYLINQMDLASAATPDPLNLKALLILSLTNPLNGNADILTFLI